MKTLNPTLEPDRGRRNSGLLVVLAVFSICACSDTLTAPEDYASPGLAATITSSPVFVGDPVVLTFTPTRPCWDEAAVMETRLSWDANRFARIDVPGIEVEQDGKGRIRIRGVDRDGFASGMSVTFRALTDGMPTDFDVGQVVMRCERGTVYVFAPPVLAARNP